MTEIKPLLIVFAGPNGSGKSTVTDAIRQYAEDFPSTYINADDIARNIGFGAYEAAVEADRQRKACIAKRQPFAMETVMSTPDKIKLMGEAKAAGYHVHLEYITTQSPAINLDRIRNRILDGGHDVPEGKTLSRYDRSMKLLPEAIKTADTARIYNNSLENPLLIAEKTTNQGVLIYPQEPPSRWDEQRIIKTIGTEGGKIILHPEGAEGNTIETVFPYPAKKGPSKKNKS